MVCDGVCDIQMFEDILKPPSKKEIMRDSYISGVKHDNLGNYKQLCAGYHRGESLLTLGPDFRVCGVAIGIVNAISILILVSVYKSELARTYFLLQFFTLILLDTVWLISGLINPGIATHDEQLSGDRCPDCEMSGMDVIKVLGRVHCFDCGVCIDDYKQHFSLTGGCVGKNNYIFHRLMYLAIFMWSITLVVTIPFIGSV